MRWLFTSVLGILLLPAQAGLARGLFDLLISLQTEGSSQQNLFWFLTGGAVWVILFVFLGRPVRLYILGHELSHLLVAWASGIGGGGLEVHADGGSVQVERSTLWVALAPYMLPLYSLILLLVFALAGSSFPTWLQSPGFPILLGMAWMFHVTFTLFALCQPQSDLKPYGTFGSLSLILAVNLLLLIFAAAVCSPDPFLSDVTGIAEHLQDSYLQAITLIKNTIFRG